jgi:hypothetical protein
MTRSPLLSFSTAFAIIARIPEGGNIFARDATVCVEKAHRIELNWTALLKIISISDHEYSSKSNTPTDSE